MYSYIVFFSDFHIFAVIQCFILFVIFICVPSNVTCCLFISVYVQVISIWKRIQVN